MSVRLTGDYIFRQAETIFFERFYLAPNAASPTGFDGRNHDSSVPNRVQSQTKSFQSLNFLNSCSKIQIQIL
jgi:hypothetical protein